MTQVLQIIGISFNLIIIRVSTNNTIESQYTMQTMDRGAQSLPHGGGGGFNLQFATGPDGAARPSDTGYTSTVVPSNASKERGIEFAHGDEESQKAPDSPEMWRVR
jgi:hypothetical protein